ncbi:MAG: restriction endonuclease subunit S [Muribaculaceae bacterium]|nr:restriction endonuclease subunit S [Muribaculaceae bacterium]
MRETDFKQTTIGSIPEGWQEKSLVDVAPLQRGFDLPQSKLRKGSYPVIYSNGIGTFHADYKCCAPGLITGRSGTLGKFTLIKEGYYWPHNTTLWVTNFNSNNPVFLYYLYSTLSFELSGTGTGVPTLNRNYLKEIRLKIPPKEEQQRIAQVLEYTDDLIFNLKKLIEKKRAIKTGALSQLLSGKLRLPGFSEPWISTSLDELGVLLSNNTLSRENLTKSGTIGNIHYGDILTKFGAILDLDNTAIPFIHPQMSSKFLKSHLAKEGDVIFADTAEDETVGKATELVNVKDRAIVSGLHSFWFRPLTKFASKYLGYAVNSHEFHQQAIPVISGTKVCSISKPNLLSFTLTYPSELEEQKAIAKVLTDMDEEISALEAKLKKYKQLKKGMMQQLLTGKIRLVSPKESLS